MYSHINARMCELVNFFDCLSNLFADSFVWSYLFIIVVEEYDCKMLIETLIGLIVRKYIMSVLVLNITNHTRIPMFTITFSGGSHTRPVTMMTINIISRWLKWRWYEGDENILSTYSLAMFTHVVCWDDCTYVTWVLDFEHISWLVSTLHFYIC